MVFPHYFLLFTEFDKMLRDMYNKIVKRTFNLVEVLL